MDYVVSFDLTRPGTDMVNLATQVHGVFDDPATNVGLLVLRMEVVGDNIDVTVGVWVRDADPGAALSRVRTMLSNAGVPVASINAVRIGELERVNLHL